MEVTRRELLKLSGLGLGSVLFAGCVIRGEEFQIQSPPALPEDLVEGADAFYATLCRQCPTPEGLIVRVMEGRAKKIEGNPDYPLNRGKHSARCEAALQALYHPDRISGPLLRESRGAAFQPASWDQALKTLEGQIRQHRGSRLAIITPPLRGHLALLVQRFAGALRAQHLVLEVPEETVLREAVKRVFGQDRLPFFDIEHAQYVLSFGADFLGNWVSPVHYSRQYGEFRQGAGRQRGTLVQVEPRFSLTAANADEWVPVIPGTEGLLAASIASVMVEEGLGDRAASDALASAVGPAVLQQARPENQAATVGVSPNRIRELARSFAKNQPALALGGGPAAAQTNGLSNLTAIYVLNLLVGNVGKPGGVFFNPPTPVEGLPDAPRATPFRDWQRLADQMRTGGVTAALVYNANPVYSLPGALRFSESLDRLPFVATFAVVMDETAAQANVVLPMHTALEDWGDDVPDPGPGYAVWGVQQPVVRPFVDSQGFGDVLFLLSEELGLGLKQSLLGLGAGDPLPPQPFKELLRRGARRLRQVQGVGHRPGLVPAASEEEFWVGLLQQGGWWDTQRQAPSVARLGAIPRPTLPVFTGDPRQFPFHLIPFPSHSLGAGEAAHLPWLQATPDPVTTMAWSTWVEVNPKDAHDLGVREGDLVEVESPVGKVEAAVYVHPALPPGRVAMPLGQGHEDYGRYAQGRGANVLKVLAPEAEKETGALAWAATKVRLNKTGRRVHVRVIKMEGAVPPLELEGFKVTQVTRG